MTVDRISSLYPTLHREIKRPIYQPKHEHTLAIFSPAKALLREPPNDSFDIDLIRTPHYLIPIGADDTRAVRFEEGVSTLPLSKVCDADAVVAAPVMNIVNFAVLSLRQATAYKSLFLQLLTGFSQHK